MDENVRVEYKGITVPEFVFRLTMNEQFDTWAAGVDAGVLSAQTGSGFTKAADTSYMYFHDDDRDGSRWWRRVPLGEQYSTAERYDETDPDAGWHRELPRSLNNLIECGGVQVAADDVPLEVL